MRIRFGSLLFLAGTLLTADYTVFVTKSVPFDSARETEIFFGTLEDYSEARTEIARRIAEHGTLGAIDGMSRGAQALAKGFFGEGLKYAGAGAVIGATVGFLDPYVMSFYADQEYVLVHRADLPDGTKALKALFFVGDKHPSLPDEEIHTLLRREGTAP